MQHHFPMCCWKLSPTERVYLAWHETQANFLLVNQGKKALWNTYDQSDSAYCLQWLCVEISRFPHRGILISWRNAQEIASYDSWRNAQEVAFYVSWRNAPKIVLYDSWRNAQNIALYDSWRNAQEIAFYDSWPDARKSVALREQVRTLGRLGIMRVERRTAVYL